MKRWTPWLMILAVVCPVAGAIAARVLTVSQIGRAFSVASMRVQRGDSILFTNDDQFDHQIYVSSPTFNYENAASAPGTVTVIKFTKSGTFEVQCQIHPRMHLAVTVD